MTISPSHHDSSSVVEDGSARSHSGIGSILAGTALIAIGVPMLVLPGPGIAAILGGGSLVARGLRRRRR